VFGARAPAAFTRGETVLVDPCLEPGKEARTVLQLLGKGKFDKAKLHLASLKLDRVAHPEWPILAGLLEFLSGRDGQGRQLEAVLDGSKPEQAQNLAELAYLRGDATAATRFYDGVPVALLAAHRLEKRVQRIREACLDAFEKEVGEALDRGDFADVRGLLDGLPPSLIRDPRRAKAAFLLACIEEKPDAARVEMPGLAPSDRDAYGDLVTALELEPSLRLSFFQRSGREKLRDPVWQLLYSRALDAWLIGNMPPAYSAAHASSAVSQRDVALLLCLYFPGLKGMAPAPMDLPPDVLGDPETDCITAVIPLGLAPAWERDALVPGEAVIGALNRAVEITGLVPPCTGTWDEYVRCGLIPLGWSPGPLSGEQVGMLVHRLRGETP
jgi:hypothetical protein